MSRFAPLLLLAASLAPTLQAQSLWYVDVLAPGPGGGTQAAPYSSIQFAIDAATTLPGDTLSIARGTYFEALDLGGKPLRFVGDFADRPVLHAAGSGSVVRMDSGEGHGTEFLDLVFTGGTGTPHFGGLSGGAVYQLRTFATFTRCRFEDNRACSSGGAIASLFGGVTLHECEFTGNRANSGGAVLVVSGTLTASLCTFEANAATPQAGCAPSGGDGGAIAVANSFTQLSQCSFRDNVAPMSGGGVFLDGNVSGHTIEQCVFERNGQQQGLAITTHAGALRAQAGATIRDCQFFDNRARANGGAVSDGLYVRCTFERNAATAGGAAYSARLEDCVVRWNDALESGGNPSEGGGTHSSEHLRTVLAGNTCVSGAGACANSFGIDRCTLIGNVGRSDMAAAEGNFVRNSIVWGNRSSGPGQPATQLGNAAVTYSLVEGHSGGLGNLSSLPLLFGEHVGDAHLLPGSPAIDTADPALPLDADGSPADMGALPYDPSYRTEAARYCVAKTTALGCVPEVSSLGLPSLSAASWQVQVAGAPPGTLGLALLATRTADSPFFGGRLCLGGPILRAVAATAQPSSGCGDVLAFSLPPTTLAATGAVAGDLLFAQVWFRDSLHPDGTGVGISDALVVTVEP